MSDVFRREYKELEWEQKNLIDTLKVDAADVMKSLFRMPEGRERAIAMTKLEECVMWATKGITK